MRLGRAAGPPGTARDGAGHQGPPRRAAHGGTVATGPGPAGPVTKEVTMTTATTPATATDRRLSPAVLVGGAFALTTLLNIAFHVGEIVFTDHDPNAPEGPIESIKSVA